MFLAHHSQHKLIESILHSSLAPLIKTKPSYSTIIYIISAPINSSTMSSTNSQLPTKLNWSFKGTTANVDSIIKQTEEFVGNDTELKKVIINARLA